MSVYIFRRDKPGPLLLVFLLLIGIGLCLYREFGYTLLHDSQSKGRHPDTVQLPKHAPDASEVASIAVPKTIVVKPEVPIKKVVQRIEIGKHDPETWEPPVVPEHLQSADQNNEELIQHIRQHWIIPPYPAGQWNIREKNRIDFSQEGQSQAVDKELGQKRNGFFVECGAGDGQFLSNSLFFERERNWTGLLIEANPKTFKSLVKTKRSSHMIHACLSPTRHPMALNFTLTKAYMGGLSDFMSNSHRNVIRKNDYVTGWSIVQCFPLASILKAIEVKHIDYFSLDIEGAEYEILKTIPFQDFDITLFTIEFLIQTDPRMTRERREAMEKLLIGQNGYRELAVIHNLDIFLRKK